MPDPVLQNQLSIEALITAPLVAASKANVVMITGQVRALLENCFYKKQGDTYEPIMIKMSLTKGFLQPDTASPDEKVIKPFTLTFSVPLVCLVPINNIVVNKVNVDFDLEITAVAPKGQKPMLAGVSPVVDDKAVLLGKISNKPASARQVQQPGETSHLKVNIDAGPLPLPTGLLTVLEIYSKSIQPADLKTSTLPAVPKTTT